MSRFLRFATILIVLLAPLTSSSEIITGKSGALKPGSRIRATVRHHESENVTRTERIEGMVLDLRDTEMRVSLDGGGIPRTVPLQDVARLEVRTRKGQRKQGALVGLGAGVAAGVVFGLAAGDDEEGFIRFSRGEKAVFLASVLAPVGALVGVAVAPGEEWRAVSVGRVRVGCGPKGLDGGAVCVVVRF